MQNADCGIKRGDCGGQSPHATLVACPLCGAHSRSAFEIRRLSPREAYIKSRSNFNELPRSKLRGYRASDFYNLNEASFGEFNPTIHENLCNLRLPRRSGRSYWGNLRIQERCNYVQSGIGIEYR